VILDQHIPRVFGVEDRRRRYAGVERDRRGVGHEGDREDGEQADAPATLAALLRLALDLIAAPFNAKAVIGTAPMLALTFVPVERSYIKWALKVSVNIAASCRLPDCF
jgi:hypothetical protein